MHHVTETSEHKKLHVVVSYKIPIMSCTGRLHSASNIFELCHLNKLCFVLNYVVKMPCGQARNTRSIMINLPKNVTTRGVKSDKLI